MFERAEFRVPGYEDLEISTQIILAAALRRGCDIEVLDRPGHLLRISRGGITQLVKEASKTALDSYMTFLLMEDKQLTKLMLERAGLPTPQGLRFTEESAALAHYPQIAERRIVVKPATTNFGAGVSVFESPPAFDHYRAAVQACLALSHAVLVEEYLPGPELRFLTLGDECVAVCNRVPANVCGDGQSTIAELVAHKNQDPWRGVGHRTPLEKIQLGETELGHLAQQGLDPTFRPERDQRVFLRRNSNISTGGDSIDRTDSVHEGYKAIAVAAARAVGARICGVDLILGDALAPPAPGNHSILELNFNPVLYIHEYPHEGKARRIGERMLDLLGFGE